MHVHTYRDISRRGTEGEEAFGVQHLSQLCPDEPLNTASIIATNKGLQYIEETVKVGSHSFNTGVFSPQPYGPDPAPSALSSGLWGVPQIRGPWSCKLDHRITKKLGWKGPPKLI